MLARIRKALDNSNKEQGFTLIEILVVMIIIGILAAIAVPTFMNQRKNGYKTTLKSDLRNGMLAIERWAVDNGGSYAGLTQTVYDDPAKIGAVGTKPYVVITVFATPVADQPTTYCISATHSLLGTDPANTWSIKKAPSGGWNEPSNKACA